jgi:hypothetical protein
MRIKNIIFTIVLLSIAFFLGALTAMIRGWGAAYVSIDVVNRSGTTLQNIAITLDSCSVNTRHIATSIAKDTTKTFKLNICGEGGYTIHAMLNDGTVLKGRDAYVESGYHVFETVKANQIETAVNSVRY